MTGYEYLILLLILVFYSVAFWWIYTDDKTVWTGGIDYEKRGTKNGKNGRTH